MATKYQIFVSSTFEDLREERDRVIQGILEMGHIPVGMEMFSAGDDEQWQIIARHIEESDYYVIMVAHRYGSMIGDLSYTRKEYEYAVKCGVPILGFVIDPGASWPVDQVEDDKKKHALLEEFKQLVRMKPVGFWSTADDLYGQSSVALMKAFISKPRTGWVRADTVAGPEVMAEITRLSAENARLRGQITQVERDAELDKTSQLSRLSRQLEGIEWEFSVRVTSGSGWVSAKKLTMERLFLILAPGMVNEMSKEKISSLIAIHAKAKSSGKAALAIPSKSRDGLLADFMSLDLMQPSTRRHPVADKAEYWSLTELGRDLLKRIKLGELRSVDSEAGVAEAEVEFAEGQIQE